MKLLADQAINDLFGGISPPAAMNIGGSDAAAGFGKLIAFGINMFILVAGIVLIIFLLTGAFDWITSGGDKEKVTKAQNKITNALIGMVIVIAVLTIFVAFAGKSLGIIVPNPDTGGFDIKLPTLQ